METMVIINGKLKGRDIMNKQNDVVVLINGKQYTLSGYESEEYMQKVASYINNKYNEAKQKSYFKHLEPDMKTIMINISIAEDYFRSRKQIEDTVYISDTKSTEIFDLKHKLIDLESKLKVAEHTIEKLSVEKLDEEKKNIRLETELNEVRKK